MGFFVCRIHTSICDAIWRKTPKRPNVNFREEAEEVAPGDRTLPIFLSLSVVHTSDRRTWELAAPTIVPNSSWLLPRSTAIDLLNEEDTLSSRHLWWGPPAPTFWVHWYILVEVYWVCEFDRFGRLRKERQSIPTYSIRTCVRIEREVSSALPNDNV